MYLEFTRFHMKINNPRFVESGLPDGQLHISSRAILGWEENIMPDDNSTIIYMLQGTIEVKESYSEVTKIIKDANAEFQNSMKVDDK